MKQNVPKSNVTVPIKKSSDIYLTPKGLVMLVVKILTYLVNSHSLLPYNSPQLLLQPLILDYCTSHPPLFWTPDSHLQGLLQLD